MKRPVLILFMTLSGVALAQPYEPTYQYQDPKTGQWVIKLAPPSGYEWREIRVTEKNTHILEILKEKPYTPPQQSGTRIPGVVVRSPERSYTPPARRAAIAEDFSGDMGQQMANICFEAIRPSFFDPYSARMDRYQTYRMPDNQPGVVVWLNGKNKFGGYVGAKPYHCYRKSNGQAKVGEGEL